MKKKLKSLAYGLIATLGAMPFLTGCGTVSTNLPSTRFESPEVQGHLYWRVAIGGGTEQSVIYTDDASARPVSFNERFGNYAEIPLMKASLGLGDNFEISARYGYPGAGLVKGKFQLLGAPASAHKAGSYSLAFTAGAGIDYTDKSGDQNGTFGPGGYNWHVNSSTAIWDFAIITGIRTSDHVLVFVSPFVSTYNLTGAIRQDQSSNGTSPAATYNLTGSGTSYGGSLGFQFYFGQKKKFSLMTDITGQNLQWSDIGNRLVLGGGLLCEFMF